MVPSRVACTGQGQAEAAMGVTCAPLALSAWPACMDHTNSFEMRIHVGIRSNLQSFILVSLLTHLSGRQLNKE